MTGVTVGAEKEPLVKNDNFFLRSCSKFGDGIVGLHGSFLRPAMQ